MKRLFGIGAGILLAALAVAVPGVMGYQGKLSNSSGVPIGQGIPDGGNLDMTFRIYDAKEVGNLLWSELLESWNESSQCKGWTIYC